MATWAKLCATSQSTSSYKANLTKAVQTLLNAKISAGLSVDGAFGAKTAAALRAFQRAHGLESDGEFGGESFTALWNA